MSVIHDDSLIIRTWYEITTSAIHARASDIHIEAGSEATLIRIRVDGFRYSRIAPLNSMIA